MRFERLKYLRAFGYITILILLFTVFSTIHCKKGSPFTAGSSWKDGCWARYRITYPDNIIEDISISIVGKEGANYILEITTLGTRRFTIGLKSPSGGILDRSEPILGQGQVVLKKGGLQAMFVPVEVLSDLFGNNIPCKPFEIPGYNMSKSGKETLLLPDGTKIETDHYRYLVQKKTLEEIWISPRVPILGIVKRTFEDGTGIMLVDYGEKGAMKQIEGEILPYDPKLFEEKPPVETGTETKPEGGEIKFKPEFRGIFGDIIKKKPEGEK
jgi:hypothetical protein